MTNKELIELLEGDETKVVIAKKKKTSGYTVFPLVKEVVPTELPIIGKCKVTKYLFIALKN